MIDSNHFHPMIVHFPIALILVGFLADTLSLFFNKKEPCLSKLGFFLMILGTLGAVAGFLSGEFFTGEMVGPAGELKEKHELFAKITMYIMIVASIGRIYLVWKQKSKKPIVWAVYILYLLGTIAVSYTGFLGGSLVLDFMTGI